MQERKRLLLFVLVGITAFYAGYLAFTDQEVVRWFRNSAYWVMVATVAAFVFWLYHAYRDCWPRIWAYLRSRTGNIGILCAVLGTLFMFRAEPWEFKTIMDEHLLAATAKSIHQSRHITTPSRVLSINTKSVPMNAFVDKRPVLQPFLVSLVHDLTGYRPLNGVYLNVALTPFMLLLLFVLADKIGGTGVGIASVALFCSIPLLSYICAGGGLQPLNLFFILLTCLLGGYYLQSPNAWRLGALVLSGILLAQCRYESVLFVLPVGLIAIWSWVRERRLLVPWVLILCPVLLVPALWQHRVFRLAKNMWQMGDGMEPFGIRYVYDNFGRAVRFFFDFGLDTPDSWLLSILGLVALLLFAVRGGRQLREFSRISPVLQASLLFLPGFLLLFLLLLGYGWEFDSPVIQRLNLPLQIPLAVAASYLIWGYITNRRVRRIAAAVLAVYFLAYAYPATSRRAYAQTYLVGHEFRLAEKFLKQHEGERMMIVADDVPYFSLYDVDCIVTNLANDSKGRFKYYLHQPGSPPVYYFRRLVYDPVNKRYKKSSSVDLDEDFVFEPAWEYTYSELRKVEFLRIVDVKGVEVEEPEYESTADYIQFWGKHLP